MTEPGNTPWGRRALDHATQITLASAGRGSATPQEAQAAAYVEKQLASLGLQKVQKQEFQGLRSIWLFLSLVFGLALVGHAAFWLLRPAFGDLPALLIYVVAFGLSGYMLWRKFTFRDFPLRQALPHGPSQNVIATIPPAAEVQQRVVLVSHLDSHRAVFWFSSEFLLRIFALSAPLSLYGITLAPVLYLLAGLTNWPFFAWTGAVLGLFHFLGWFTGITADLGPYSPGANDNAAAVGVNLALAERLKAQPLQHTEVWLAFTGCEETGCDGLLAFLDAYKTSLPPGNTLVVDFELAGIGDQVAYLRQEGVIRRRCIDPALECLVQQAGVDFNLRPVSALTSCAFTESGAAWEHGYKAVCILSQRSSPPPGRFEAAMPEWHRLTDTPDKLESSALERIQGLAWKILQVVEAVT
ncbi:MAG: M28 family peptidase [Anaerolineales bacterium]|nr:M28 family peptidase [Anaerolineales bacterium]